MTVAMIAAALLTLAALAAEAQPAGTIPKIGLLGPGTPSTTFMSVQKVHFERGLRELGWTPGVDLMLEYRYSGESAARQTELAAELIGLGVDLIVARGPDAVRAVRQRSARIPIVMATVDDPVGGGLVESLARPRGNAIPPASPIERGSSTASDSPC